VCNIGRGITFSGGLASCGVLRDYLGSFISVYEAKLSPCGEAMGNFNVLKLAWSTLLKFGDSISFFYSLNFFLFLYKRGPKTHSLNSITLLKDGWSTTHPHHILAEDINRLYNNIGEVILGVLFSVRLIKLQIVLLSMA